MFIYFVRPRTTRNDNQQQKNETSPTINEEFNSTTTGKSHTILSWLSQIPNLYQYLFLFFSFLFFCISFDSFRSIGMTGNRKKTNKTTGRQIIAHQSYIYFKKKGKERSYVICRFSTGLWLLYFTVDWEYELKGYWIYRNSFDCLNYKGNSNSFDCPNYKGIQQVVRIIRMTRGN